VAALPPVSIMFAALLGYNPVQTLLGHVVSRLPASHAAYLTGHTFFPSLISVPFEHGLAIAFYFAIAACLIAAVASLLRGGKYVHGVHPAPVARATRARQEPVASQIPAARPVRASGRAPEASPVRASGRAPEASPVRGANGQMSAANSKISAANGQASRRAAAGHATHGQHAR